VHGWGPFAPHLGGWLGVGAEVVALTLVPLALLRRKDPSSTIAWILALLFLPGLGAFLFLAFGRQRVRWPAKRKREVDALVRAELAAHAPGVLPSPDDSAVFFAESPVTDLERALFKVGAHLTHGRASSGNRLEPLLGGNATYDALGAAIDGACHHVHAEYYLIRNDATGAWFKDRLLAAAKRGVEVRLLCDAYGCLGVPASYFRALTKGGVRVGTFLPMRSMLLQPVNLRNHRKIVVVDGTVAFTGGLNIGDEYRGQMKGVGEWRDLHVRIEGAAARDLQRVFIQDWSFVAREVLHPAAYFPAPGKGGGGATIAIIPSGPDTANEAIERIFFGAIAGSQKHAWITTPYFVPDEAITVALELAAMRGVDVKILLPSHSNHRVTFHAGRSYYERLLEAGVKIYEYLPGIVHAKAMVIDGTVSLVGSANMDLRSFRLNFEVHALVHDRDVARRLEEGFAAYIAKSQLVSLPAWRERGLRLRMYEGAARLVSPLL
jgi:cardiolipin synthase